MLCLWYNESARTACTMLSTIKVASPWYWWRPAWGLSSIPYRVSLYYCIRLSPNEMPNSFFVIFSWFYLGSSMVCPWFFNSIFVVSPWFYYGIFVFFHDFIMFFHLVFGWYFFVLVFKMFQAEELLASTLLHLQLCFLTKLALKCSR